MVNLMDNKALNKKLFGKKIKDYREEMQFTQLNFNEIFHVETISSIFQVNDHQNLTRDISTLRMHPSNLEVQRVTNLLDITPKKKLDFLQICRTKC